jgi:DNA polymerase-3 subunit alpha
MDVQEFSAEYKTSADSKKIVDTAFGLEGLVRQTGIHAAGIVISKDPLTEYLPIMQKGADSPVVTQWDMGRVEQCGLLKIDFLGLRNLGVIDYCIKLIKQNYGLDIDVDSIPLDDRSTFEELQRGNAIGVFQLESSGMRQLMVQLQPQNIEDIMALISLYRPGPMGSGMDRLYIDRKHGRSKISYDHPSLEKVLGPSLGIMLYQEDVLGVARELAGFSSAEADDLRKAIGKKQMDKISLFRKKFVEGCVKHSSLAEDRANKIYSDIEYFGGYGFNRAHAASYAMISYITAYLKVNYTSEYMAALMSSVLGNKEKQALYLSDCRKLGINVLPPSINKSDKDFKVLEDNNIIFGLSAINGIGDSIAESIIECRDEKKPYLTIYDFFRRCDSSILKKSTLEHLAMSGALDELINDYPEEVLQRRDELNLLEKEKEELGIYVSKHPMQNLMEHISPQIDAEIAEVNDIQSGYNVKIGAIITGVKKIITKKGQKMFKLLAEDLTGEIEILVFPREAKNIEDSFFSLGDVFIFNGFLNRENEDEKSIVKLFYNSSTKIDTDKAIGVKSIVLESNISPSLETIKRLYDIIENTNGSSNVYVKYIEDNKKITFKFNKTTSPKVEDQLKEIIKIGI